MSSLSSVKNSVLGAANNVLGMVNLSTLVIAFVLSLMVVNTYKQCTPDNVNKGTYNSGLNKASFMLSCVLLIVIVFLLLITAYNHFKK